MGKKNKPITINSPRAPLPLTFLWPKVGHSEYFVFLLPDNCLDAISSSVTRSGKT